jgi:hypothetical protein
MLCNIQTTTVEGHTVIISEIKLRVFVGINVIYPTFPVKGTIIIPPAKGKVRTKRRYSIWKTDGSLMGIGNSTYDIVITEELRKAIEAADLEV